jgi:hypothetical protein
MRGTKLVLFNESRTISFVTPLFLSGNKKVDRQVRITAKRAMKARTNSTMICILMGRAKKRRGFRRGMGDEDVDSTIVNLSLPVKKANTPISFDRGVLNYSRRRPTLPDTCASSTIGDERLNGSVRNGKRCCPFSIVGGKSVGR